MRQTLYLKITRANGALDYVASERHPSWEMQGKAANGEDLSSRILTLLSERNSSSLYFSPHMIDLSLYETERSLAKRVRKELPSVGIPFEGEGLNT